MFPFFLKKTRRAALFAGLVPVLLIGLLFVSCDQPTNGSVVNALAPSITAITTDPVGGEWNVNEDEEFTLTATASSPDGGKLSYQWYENTSNSTNGGKTIGEDEAILTLEKNDYLYNDDYYFYVVVTNTNNSVSGNKTATATSNAVKVTVTGNLVNARPPSITGQPQGGEWNVEDDDEFPLTVTVSSPDGGTLSYQWYENTSNSTTGGIEIGEDNEILTLVKTDYTGDGELYFYVVVTNTISNNNDGGKKTATVTSTVATVTVSGNGVAIVHAEQPEITGQPTGNTWNVSNTNSLTLTVTASVTDGGELSFQWYKNTSNTTTGGTEVGTNSETLSLAKEDYATDGTYYFYVVVTNTNNSVSGNKTATATSEAVKVTVTGNIAEPEVSLPAGLSGYFQSPFEQYFAHDGFVIDPEAKTFYYYADSAMETYWGGPIVRHLLEDDETEEPAILIVFIEASEGEWYDPTSVPAVGKYTAAAYKNFASSGGFTVVNSSTAYKTGSEKNAGVDTIEEAVSEYTDANGYYYSPTPLYRLHPITVADLAAVQGKWAMDEDENYIINILGTTFTDWYDDEDGSYDPWDWYSDDELTAMGDIVGYTGNGTSGILYIKVAMSEVYDVGDYIAVAWKNKSGDTIDFMTSTDEEATLAAIKAAYPNASDEYFDDDGFYSYKR